MNVFDEIIDSVHMEPGRGIAVRWLMSPANVRDCELLKARDDSGLRLRRRPSGLYLDGVPVVVDPAREHPALIVEQAIDEASLRRRDEAARERVEAHHAGSSEIEFLRDLGDRLQCIFAARIKEANAAHHGARSEAEFIGNLIEALDRQDSCLYREPGASVSSAGLRAVLAARLRKVSGVGLTERQTVEKLEAAVGAEPRAPVHEWRYDPISGLPVGVRPERTP